MTDLQEDSLTAVVTEQHIQPPDQPIDPQAKIQLSAPLSSWQFLKVWLALGINSFGGGAATIYLIRRAATERHHWISPEEFTRDFAICQLTPGINILALTILLGRRFGGIRGIALALIGLLLPSVTITIALTAVFVQVQQLAVVQAALRGVIPSTIGLGAVLAWQLGQPLLQQSRREGRTMLAVSSCVLIGSGLVALLLDPPVGLILLIAGLMGAVVQHRAQRRRS